MISSIGDSFIQLISTFTIQKNGFKIFLLICGMFGLQFSSLPSHAMTMEYEPDCEYLSVVLRNPSDVRIVRNGERLTKVTEDEFESAALTAMNRWNQQSESSTYFSYEGRTIYSSACDGFNRIQARSDCSIANTSAPAWIDFECPVVEDGVTKWNWNITVCDNYTSGGSMYSTDYGVGKVSAGLDLLSTLMHELGHAQGLAHPGVSTVADPNQSPEAYCNGNAAVMGGRSCDSQMGVRARRDLYRYDSFCAESAPGNTTRKHDIYVLAEIEESFYDGSYDNFNGANASVWETDDVNQVKYEVAKSSILQWFNQFDLNTNTADKTWLLDRSARVPQPPMLGEPHELSTTGVLRNHLYNFASNSNWLQKFSAVWGRNTDASPWIPNDLQMCADSSCTSTVDVHSKYPIQLISVPGTSEIYALWVEMVRSAGSQKENRVRLSEYVSEGLLGPDLIDEDDVLQSTSRPTMECTPRYEFSSSSYLEFCFLYYVPLDETLGRIHVQTLFTGSGSDKFVAGTEPTPIYDHDTLEEISTGGPLVSWPVERHDEVEEMYLAYIKNERGFPVGIVRGGVGHQGVKSEGTFGPGPAMNLSVSRNTSELIRWLIWTGP